MGENYRGLKYDIYCEHSVYDEHTLMKVLHHDTVNVAIIREPLSHLRSVFQYADLGQFLQLSESSDPVADFLQKPEYYVARYRGHVREYTQDWMTHEFGYEESHHTDLDKFFKYINSKFLVLVLERLAESLVLLKNTLCWSFKDVLYFRMRKAVQMQQDPPNDTLIRQQHQAWSPIDYKLYAYFHTTLEHRLLEAGSRFFTEVALLEKHVQKTTMFCDEICQRLGKIVHSNFTDKDSMLSVIDDYVTFESSDFEDSYDVSGLDCLMMKFDPNVYRAAQKLRTFPSQCRFSSPGMDIPRYYCEDHFKYNFPWQLLRDSANTFLSPCF